MEAAISIGPELWVGLWIGVSVGVLFGLAALLGLFFFGRLRAADRDELAQLKRRVLAVENRLDMPPLPELQAVFSEGASPEVYGPVEETDRQRITWRPPSPRRR